MTVSSPNPAFLKEQAQALLQQNQLPQARDMYTRICETDPHDAQAWHMLGVINVQMGNMQEAAAAWSRAVAAAPEFAEGHCNLGNALFCLGRREEAVDHYREALRLQPDYSEALNNMGTVLNELNRLDEAAQCYETALGLAPSALLHYNLANVLTLQQRLGEAVNHYERALALEPNRPEIYNNMGNALRHSGRYEEAAGAYRKALQLDPDHPMAFEAHANLGNVLLNLNRLDEARASFERALQLKPDLPRAVAGIASGMEKKGEYQQAYSMLKPYLDKDEEDSTMALTFASISRHLGLCEDAIARMERLLSGEKPATLDVFDRILLHFSLGARLDAIGAYDRAFDHYRRGNELVDARFNSQHFARHIDALIDAFNADFMSQAPRARHGSRQPVFIVGMPRSGTSLVEQILASHPDVFGAGELEEIYHIVTDLPDQLGGHSAYPQCLNGLTPALVDGLARRYLDYLASLAPPGAARITDKMPANFLHLGLITLLFPQARIIHCVREPLDTCLSCYFQYFTFGQYFSYDLTHLGIYYRQYQRLMAHWRRVLKMPMMEVQYEELVADQERISRDLVEFCGLQWDDRCLRFHETRRLVNTASYDQVRQPMYSRSAGRWRHYERHLEPLRRALDGPVASEGSPDPTADDNGDRRSAQALKKAAFDNLQKGRLDEAKAMFTQALELDGTDGEAWFMLGTLNGQLGAIDEAEACLRRSVELQPQRPEAHFNLGKALEDQGRYEDALQPYRQTISLNPEFIAAHAQIGNLLQAQGQLEEALPSHREVVRLAPNMAEAHYNLANTLKGLKRYPEAIGAYRQALWIKPELAEGHYGLGLALVEIHRHQEAEAAYREAVRLKPDYAEAHHNLGNLLNKMGRYDEAVIAYRKSLRLRPDQVDALNNLGSAHVQTGNLEAAKNCYQKALALDGKSKRAIAGIANVLDRQGRSEEAYEILKPLLTPESVDPFAATVFSDMCRPLGRCDEAIALLEHLLGDDRPLSDEYRAVLLGELGHLYDRKGEYDAAFFNFNRGNNIKSRIWPFDLKAHERRIETLITTYSHEFMTRAPRAASASQRPVFIVGMPRSGTSLVEQILASHPAVFGAGELEELHRITSRLSDALESPLPYPQCMTNLSEVQCEQLSNLYLRHIDDRAPPSAARVTDKMPTNFLHLGLIALLFPHARVIHCVRDPLDTCLSCYFQNFGPGLACTFDLEKLGTFHRLYQRLMSHWRSVLTVPMMEVRYEDLVANQETVSRAMVEFCGLKWDRHCLNFHETSRVVTTASYDQVRQPMYRRSVERWRRYERHLGPLRRSLSPDFPPTDDIGTDE